ncbi:MAG: protein kinase [Verrucomicrobia bacterium]|nr:protein kinase [Verrucomicrobiota bacterium]
MMNPSHERLKQVLAEAAAQPTPAARSAYLDAVCKGDASLRGEIEALLKAHNHAGDFLEEPLLVRQEEPLGAGPGSLIGRYKLLQEIGEGGFGRVFMAEQQEPVRRKVALKIIKAGMDTREVIARFEAERQALALMDHPNIARVFDAGATESGRPYFVMELVQGIPVTTYGDENHLPTGERLNLFVRVCNAVQHAHQKGVIHRDLKPTNVLVTVIDGEAIPKVIDFGVAKAIGQELTEKTLFTRFQEMVGTPAYMSPEQAAVSGMDVDTRADIYSLGVLLYELLTGVTPFDRETMARAGLDAIRKMIRETEPPKPSTRLHALGEKLTEVAERRHTEPATLRKLVRGDLDWIVMKALEKDRARRYETASAFAEDVRRHLNHELVAARPPSMAYRLHKFARRHRGPVLGAAAILAALLLGLWLATAGFIRARNERNRALAAEAQAEAGRMEAEQHRQRAEASLRAMELQAARQFFARDQPARALSLLARRLRQNPADLVVAEWLVNELAHRNFAVPALQPIAHDDCVTFARFSPDGRTLLTAARNNRARVWDAATGQPVSAPLQHDPTLVAAGEFLGGVHPLVAEFSPDGRRVVTGSIDHTARIWDAATGKPLLPPLPHSNWVTWIAFSPDGERLATACKDGATRLWNAATGDPLGPVLRHTQWVNSVQFSPDGRSVVTASDDQTAQVWDAASGRPVGQRLRHRGDVRHAVFSPDGRRVATASADHKARIWDAQTGEPVSPPLPHGGTVLWVAFSPDGLFLLTAAFDKTARLWDAYTGEPFGSPLRHDDVVRYARFSPEGRRVVTASRDKTARVWDVWTQEPLTEPMRHHAVVGTAEFSPDGHSLVTASADRTAQVWDIRPGRALVHALPHVMRVESVCWSPDGRRVLGVSPRRTRVWDVDTGYPLEGAMFSRQQGVTHAGFSPDGQRLVVASDDGTARVWDGQGQQTLTPPMNHEAPVRHAEFSPDDRFVVTASADRTARLWISASGQPSGPPLRHTDTVRKAHFSPDAKNLVTVCNDKTARLWSVDTGQETVPALGHGDLVVCAQFSPSGKQVVTASSDQSARVWHAGSGHPLCRPLRHAAPVLSAQFSPDGARIVTASADETARIWDWRSGRQIGEPLIHQGRLNWAEFSPDSQRVLTASIDRTAGLWDARSGFVLSTGLKHHALVEHAQFSPDGHRIATASFDYTVRIWEVARPQSPAPAWLPDLAEAVAGERLSEQGAAVPVTAAQFFEVKSRLESLPGDDDYARWARWFLADRSTRPASPGARRSTRDFVNGVVARWPGIDQLASWFEAAKLEPTNGLICAGIAWNYLELGSTDRTALNTGDCQSRRALEFAPDHPISWRVRSRSLEKHGHTNAALQMFERGSNQASADPWYLSEYAGMLERAGRIADAWRKWESTLAILQTQPQFDDSARVAFARYAGQFLRTHALDLRPHLNRGFERLRTLLDIPARDPACPPHLVDLTPFYSCALDKPWLALEPRRLDLRTLPHGRVNLAGIEFDVRGLVQLTSAVLADLQPVFPDRFTAIPVNLRARRLHFLHGADGPDAEGARVATCVVHYADGHQQEIHILYGQNILAWLTEGNQPDPQPPFVAWRTSAAGGVTLQLCCLTWENPHPDAAIDKIDFMSAKTQAAPFLVALTAEP